MTSDACPTCGDLCGMREFGWEGDDMLPESERRIVERPGEEDE